MNAQNTIISETKTMIYYDYDSFPILILKVSLNWSTGQGNHFQQIKLKNW